MSAPYFRGFLEFYSALENGRAGSPSTLDENRARRAAGVRRPARAVRQRCRADVAARAAGAALRLGPPHRCARRPQCAAQVRRRAGDAGGGRLAGRRACRAADRAADGRVRRPDRRSPAALGRLCHGPAVRRRIKRSSSITWAFATNRQSYDQGRADEHRHSLGARLAGAAGGWDWDLEALYQFGSFGSGEIRAWTVASTTGYRFARAAVAAACRLERQYRQRRPRRQRRGFADVQPAFPARQLFLGAGAVGPAEFLRRASRP